MNSSTTLTGEPGADGVRKDGEPLTWEVRLGDRDPAKRWVALACAIGAGFVGVVLFKSLVLGLIGFAAILASVPEILFPLKYRLDSDAATVRCGISVTQVAWENVKRVVQTEEGLKLSPLAANSRLEPFRGVYLRFAGNEAEVLAKVRALWGREDGFLAKRTD